MELAADGAIILEALRRGTRKEVSDVKVLAVSHSCAADVNQQWYVALSEIPGIEIELIVPSNWRDDCTGARLPPRVLPAIRFPVRFLPVLFPGRISTHFYLPGIGP